ncbi:hypothetical protein T11_5063 [Trichinella zimbabwensis]|uniref:Uncharacterized protein n=1 Tax=Trichinella zimbabwensis TaxID=268475 RepID=A0A0V1HY94_9BILA|nr:hypothetical protein T11_5063 [Trichinella zimbabwensis]
MRHGILGSVISVRSFLELLENHNSASVSSRLPFNEIAARHVCCSEREQCGNHSSSHVGRIAKPAIWSSQSRRPEAHRQDDPAAALCTSQLEKLTLDTYRDYQALASVQRFLPKKISRKKSGHFPVYSDRPCAKFSGHLFENYWIRFTKECAELETFYQLTPNQCGGCNASVVLHSLSVAALQAVLQQSNQQQHCIEKFEY